MVTIEGILQSRATPMSMVALALHQLSLIGSLIPQVGKMVHTNSLFTTLIQAAELLTHRLGISQ